MKIQTTGKVGNYRSSPVTGKQLMLRIDDDIAEQLDQIKDKAIKITIQPLVDSRKRSKNANAYLWTLLNALQGEGFGSSKENYLRYIREDGVSFASELPQERFRTFEYSFTHLGLGFQVEATDEYTWIDEFGEYRPMVGYIAYYGSHVYNRKQMAHLLDAVVQDCQAVGIQTETPEEQARLIEEWDA